MFVDEAEIIVKGGNGGDGNISFFPGVKSGPSGGRGGNGGDVYLMGERNMADLYKYVSKKNTKPLTVKKAKIFRKKAQPVKILFLKYRSEPS